MRNLTIKRTKTYVASLIKMKIYIEDPMCGEIVINGASCRKIGDLKNGEEKTFQIGEQQTKVFVIADTASKNFCNEFYTLPEGQDDIYLTGKNKFNVANGNAFRFDNNESEDVLSNRKRGVRKGLLVLLVAILIGAASGFAVGSGLFSNEKLQEKTFSSDGMSVTLTDEFEKIDVEQFTVSYACDEVVTYALKEQFSLMDGFENYTVRQYGELVMQINGLDPDDLQSKDGLTYFVYQYTNPETNDTYQYYSYLYKAGDAFWTVQFVTLDKNAEKYASQIEAWANSITFPG